MARRTHRIAGHRLIGLALVLVAASPAVTVFGLPGRVQAADTPPAVAPPVDAATSPTATPPPSEVAPPAAPAEDLMYRRDRYDYLSGSLRDPFASLVEGNFVSDSQDRLPDIGSLSLLGVIWGDRDKFALCEDSKGNSFVLRVGDPVVNGEVAGITRESLTIRQHFFGSSTTVTLKLKPREDKGHATK